MTTLYEKFKQFNRLKKEWEVKYKLVVLESKSTALGLKKSKKQKYENANNF